MANKSRTIILLIIIIVLLSSCTNTKFEEFVFQYKNIYIEIAKSIDPNDLTGSLKILQTEENLKKLEKLDGLLTRIKENVPRNREEQYILYVELYNGLILLKNINVTDIEFLSEIERRELSLELIYIKHTVIIIE